jgi:hypothetical protein
MVISALLVGSALILPRVGIGASARLYQLTVLSDNADAYWRLDEPGGNVAHDRVGGHDAGELDKSGNGIPNLNFAQPSGSNAERMNSAGRT